MLTIGREMCWWKLVAQEMTPGDKGKDERKMWRLSKLLKIRLLIATKAAAAAANAKFSCWKKLCFVQQNNIVHLFQIYFSSSSSAPLGDSADKWERGGQVQLRWCNTTRTTTTMKEKRPSCNRQTHTQTETEKLPVCLEAKMRTRPRDDPSWRRRRRRKVHVVVEHVLSSPYKHTQDT